MDTVDSLASSILSIYESEPIVQVHSEVEAGRIFRYHKKHAKKPSIIPAGFPINFQRMWDRYQLTKRLEELQLLEQQMALQGPVKALKLPHHKEGIDRNTASKKKYFDFLATPHKYVEPPPEPDEKYFIKKKLRTKEVCSPRLLQLAMPTKTRILYTWKDFGSILPVNCITHLEEMLRQDRDLDPKFATCYFKTLDSKKRKQRALLRRLKRMKKRKQRKACKKWLIDQINATVEVIVNFFKNEPLFDLNFRQMLISQTLLTDLTGRGHLKNLVRGTSNLFKRAQIDIIDQVAVWIDTLMRYIDAQYSESLTDFGEFPSIEELGEEEGEEEEEEGEEEFAIFEVDEEAYPEAAVFEEILKIEEMEEVAEEDFSGFGQEITEELVEVAEVEEEEPSAEPDLDDEGEEEVVLPPIEIIETGEEFVEEGVFVEEDLSTIETSVVEEGEETPLFEEGSLSDFDATLLATAAIHVKVDERGEAEGIAGLMTKVGEEEGYEKSPYTELMQLGEESLKRGDSLKAELAALAAEGAEAEAGYDAKAGICGAARKGIILGHKPSQVFEHRPDMICCLTLKIWATWLLEVAHNAHLWSRWLNDIINEVRHIAAIIRGEVMDEDGKPLVFYREDWIEFSQKVDKMIVSWRQYSMHVSDLTSKITANFRDKEVFCCPKCLQDNLIVDVVLAHNITEQLTEAMNTAAYWRRWVDDIVMETNRLTHAVDQADEEIEVMSGDSTDGTIEIIELHHPQPQESYSDESIYEIEELDPDFD